MVFRDHLLHFHFFIRLLFAQGLLLPPTISWREWLSVHSGRKSVFITHDWCHENILLNWNGKASGSLLHARLHSIWRELLRVRSSPFISYILDLLLLYNEHVDGRNFRTFRSWLIRRHSRIGKRISGIQRPQFQYTHILFRPSYRVLDASKSRNIYLLLYLWNLGWVFESLLTIKWILNPDFSISLFHNGLNAHFIISHASILDLLYYRIIH